MDSIFEKLVAALIVAVLTWLVARYYNRSRLYCAPSRLYEYSNLVDGSSTVQLVIANRGRKSEESVEVQLSTDYEYHLLAATQNGIEISKDKIIRLATLLPGSEVSLIIVAEGKPRFSKEGIRDIRSKTAKGSIGASLAEAESSLPGVLPATILLLVVVALFGYGLGKTVGEDAWRWGQRKLLTINAQKFTEGCFSVLSNGAKEVKKGELGEKHLGALAISAIKVKQVSAQGDMLFVDIEIENPIEGPIEYSLNLLSHVSDSSTDWKLGRDKQVYNIVMLDKGEKRAYSLSDYFPSDRKPKRFWLEARVELLGYWVTVKRSFFFGEDSSLTCPALEKS